MKIISAIFVFLVGSSLLISGCGKPQDKNIVLASVGTERITMADFNERISNLPPRYREIVQKRKDEYLQELVNNTILYQEAMRKGLNKDPEVQRVIEEATKKIMVAKFLKDEIDEKVEITDVEVVEFYNDNKEHYKTPEIMRVSHILVPTQEEAESILKELKTGKNFDDLARAKSVDPTAQRGGDIGYFPKGQLMPEFDNAASQLEVGQVSGVVKTKLGYHIIKLTDRREPQVRPLEKVTQDIKARLAAIKRQKALNDLIAKLRKKTPIKVNTEALTNQEENK